MNNSGIYYWKVRDDIDTINYTLKTKCLQPNMATQIVSPKNNFEFLKREI